MSTNNALIEDIDALGFSKKYPKYYFDDKVINEKITYKTIKINDDFIIPENKLDVWKKIKVRHTKKYNFIQCGLDNNGYDMFVSGKYHFLNNYCFSFIECFESEDIYYVSITKRTRLNKYK